MCSAEDELRGMEHEVQFLNEKIDDIMDLVDDCDRGIISPSELRGRIERLPTRRRRALGTLGLVA